jgi:hypothetical protein
MFRHGQWVLFTKIAVGEIAAAHRGAAGKVVGIYQRAASDPLTGQERPAHIVPVDANGANLMFPISGFPAGTTPAGEAAGVARCILLLDQVSDVEPLLDRADLPPGRVLNPEFQLRP